jgi:hypothetical protein
LWFSLDWQKRRAKSEPRSSPLENGKKRGQNLCRKVVLVEFGKKGQLS